MAFTVPTTEPATTVGLIAGDWIEASSMNSLVQRDRFVFATRRRLIASLPKVTTTASASFQVACGFKAITLPSSNGTLIFGFVASDDASVRVVAGSSTATVTTGASNSRIGVVTGVPINTWFGVTVEVKSNTGAPVTISGIYIAEQVLVAADLP
jgi:negative regulator of sigma E activity